ncbi:peptide deformylase [Streptacidiphilus sp. ASG 303]|uniref:peptide deformylase n=1 Tax=Streptacidiphilus sp. ASG 303 TaxID=2896847 RepID=UPI001E442E16|nr:peptide deformylase [Streptacidiphilus sp. ASG 303]MCD0485626.1 peptide deformylase [Streptacidiphilus sp. ASG 303]
MSSEAPSAEPFIAELKRWRDVRGVSQSALARSVGYTPSYVSKVEGGQQRPSREFAEQADRVLSAGGALRRTFTELETGGRPGITLPHQHTAEPQTLESQPASLIVVHDDAELRYDGATYRATQRRRIHNASPDPITQYLIRISVDRYPGNPEHSNRHYRDNPLTWDEIALTARIGNEPIGWRVQHDRDAFKELWLLFENDDGRYPLYPGETAWIEYSYTVSDDKWGTWFQRAVRLPTERLSVRLDFPADLDPVVWGTETTMTAAAFPFRTAIHQSSYGDRRLFSWTTDDPPLHARYRLEWKFRARPDHEETAPAMPASASEKMRSIGVVQAGDPLLTQRARPFDLPAEAEDARRVVAELNSAAERAAGIHTFSKGMGCAAPQIGIDRAAAIVRTPNGETLTLLNPRVIEESAETDEQYEGCWSFFDVRGMVPRPLSITVEHQDTDGQRRITIFDQGVARLVAHEIDHLEGVLYTTRMRPGVEPIPVSQYRGTGRIWSYEGKAS